MIKFLFLTIPNQYTYQQLKNPISFKQDIYGVTTWTMKHPLTIFSSDLKMKHIFKHNEVKLQAITNPVLEQKWRYFVITKKDGGKYYCTSQIIYQKGLLRSSNLSQSQFFGTYQATNTLSGQQYYLPRCIVLISQLPYFKLQQGKQINRHKVNLLKIHKELKKQQPAISHCIEEDLYEMYLEYLETGRQKEWQGLNINQIKSKRRTYCPLELSFSYYVQCCNSHQAGECIYIQKATSRQVLHLYKLYPSSLYQIGYFFHLPLSATSLRKIISGILTQKQIVFSSSNANLTVMVIETLMQMILPLKWCYMYAPNLPVELIQAAQESFMPYIVGISKQHLPLISKTNKIIVHIDTDEIETVFEQQQEQLRMLSKKFQKLLTWKSNSNKQYLQWQKQLRINSILLITTIFKKDLPLDKQHHHRKYQSQQQKLSQQKFYQQFLSKSMMYRKLIEDLHQKVYSEFYKLTKMDFTQRKNFLVNKFNSLHSQTIYPTKSDNKKQWIRYYQKYMRCKRRSRLNRHSLSMVENSLSGINSYPSLVPFYVSNVSGNSSIGVNGGSNGGSRFNGSVVMGQYGNNNNVNSISSGYFNANINNNNTNNINLNNSANIHNSTNPTDSTYPTYPNTPSTTTTTHQHQQPLPTHKPQFFSSRNNQLYQSSVSTGSYSNGLKFHLGMGRNSSKDIFQNNNGSSTKLRKESMAMSSIHYQGVDQQNGKGKQGQQFTQQVHSLQFNTSVNNLNNIQPMSQQQQESFSSRQYQYSTINPTSMNNNNTSNNPQPLNNNSTLSTNPNPNQQPPLINNNNILRTSSINSIQNNFIKSTNTNNNNNFIPTLSRVNEGSFEYSSSTITGNNQSNNLNSNNMNMNNNFVNNTTNNGSSQLNYNNSNMMMMNNNVQYQNNTSTTIVSGNNNPYMFGNNNISNNNNNQVNINNSLVHATGNNNMSNNNQVNINNNNQNINNNFLNNKTNHNSMIFTNQPNIQQPQHPLNQSMVASFIFPNNQNPSTTSPINTSSHRNLPSTQSTIVL